ncbi:hypothetical protein [Methylotuvimicrobium buryatense]|uniref:Prepilin-type N-terminal cleavage/methylation domain-containing protein n=1 Tax=Methylotuvimicrobium buryatense TaxID=95641 RepID=A0A4P9UTJ4_METBY|nr:hypothetical protein [Methylotuvimicrobium buryatense]QCW83026.1 hypothetical protein EQU24_12845 [Methylotuvimicrobium buryatense]
MKKVMGFTLMELMISLLLGLIIIGTIITVYIATIRGSSDVIGSARLNHDMESAMMLMTNDIRRTGYWGGAVDGSDSRNNPFTSPTTDIAVIDFNGTGDCILYSYDANGSGHFDNNGDGTVDDTNEFYGFRLNNNTIEMRLTGVNTTDCSNTNANWQAMTLNAGGEQINITNLEFSFGPLAGLAGTSRCFNFSTKTITDDAIDCDPAPSTGDNVIQKRVVNIRMTGVLANDVNVSKTINGTVQIRNDRLYTQP